MRRIFACALLVVACVGLLAACGRRGADSAGREAATGGGVDEVVGELNAFTEELLGKVEAAPQPAAGLAAAQQHLDAHKAALAAHIAALKRSPEFRESREAGRKWLDAEVENTSRVSGLRTRYLDAAMADPALKSQLDRLIGEYQDLFKE